MNTRRSQRSCPTADRCSKNARSGLSVLEFLGCLIALVGGAWLGAIYLGIDVRHVAYVALSESELMEKVPEQWRPAEPAPAEGAPTPAQLAEAVQEELVALRHEITALRTTRHTPPAAGTNPSPTVAAVPESADAHQLAKQASLDYWSRIHDIVRGQAALQLDAESAATEGNATKVAALKGRISRFSSRAIRAIPTNHVDPAAVALAKELAQWYENGGLLYDQAVQIWESPARGQSGPQITKEWEHARLQHRNESRLLGDQIAAVRDSLTRRFGEGFAEIAGL
jgi:hypothetical protein